jgi:hypothetical protein
MMMLRAEGLTAARRECWARYPQTITKFGTPSERMLFTGMAIGYQDTSHSDQPAGHATRRWTSSPSSTASDPKEPPWPACPILKNRVAAEHQT